MDHWLVKALAEGGAQDVWAPAPLLLMPKVPFCQGLSFILWRPANGPYSRQLTSHDHLSPEVIRDMPYAKLQPVRVSSGIICLWGCHVVSGTGMFCMLGDGASMDLSLSHRSLIWLGSVEFRGPVNTAPLLRLTVQNHKILNLLSWRTKRDSKTTHLSFFFMNNE